MDDLEDLDERRVVRALLHLRLRARVRVDDLVAQRADGEVRALRHVKEVRLRGLGDHAVKLGPKVAKDAEQGRLAAAVRAGDQAVHAGADLKVERAHKNVAVRGHNRHILEFDDLAGMLERE